MLDLKMKSQSKKEEKEKKKNRTNVFFSLLFEPSFIFFLYIFLGSPS